MRKLDIQRRPIPLLKQLGMAAHYALFIRVDHSHFESGATDSSFAAAGGFAVPTIGGGRYAWGTIQMTCPPAKWNSAQHQ